LPFKTEVSYLPRTYPDSSDASHSRPKRHVNVSDALRVAEV